MDLAFILFKVVLILLALPVMVFTLQVLAALLPVKQTIKFNSHLDILQNESHPTVAILIPAHNEQHGIVATLDSIKPQLSVNDRIIVVADNCEDETAAVARTNGATVIERNDLVNQGKSYALDFGVRYLETQLPPQVVIIVDADCLVQAHGITLLAHQAVKNNRPIQALYLMKSPIGAGIKLKVTEFAWAVKNWARALGYQRLGLPCQLMGAGMAFPWPLIQQANIASGHIVEDLKLGLEFANLKHAPLFLADAVVISTFPLNNEGIKSQRTRWEHGHLAMIVKEGPLLISKSLFSFNIGMLALALDMCVPPLALLTMLVVALTFIGMLMILITHNFLPWGLPLVLLITLGTTVLLAWIKFGREILSFSNLVYVPFYMLVKIPLYFKFIVKRQAEWVRSKRD